MLCATAACLPIPLTSPSAHAMSDSVGRPRPRPPQARSRWAELPTDVLVSVLAHLSIHERVAAISTCKASACSVCSLLPPLLPPLLLPPAGPALKPCKAHACPPLSAFPGVAAHRGRAARPLGGPALCHAPRRQPPQRAAQTAEPGRLLPALRLRHAQPKHRGACAARCTARCAQGCGAGGAGGGRVAAVSVAGHQPRVLAGLAAAPAAAALAAPQLKGRRAVLDRRPAAPVAADAPAAGRAACSYSCGHCQVCDWVQMCVQRSLPAGWTVLGLSRAARAARVCPPETFASYICRL